MNKFGQTDSGSTSIVGEITNIFASDVTIQSLSASMPVKTNGLRKLVSSKLDISDINSLQYTLDNFSGSNSIKNDTTASQTVLGELKVGKLKIKSNNTKSLDLWNTSLAPGDAVVSTYLDGTSEANHITCSNGGVTPPLYVDNLMILHCNGIYSSFLTATLIAGESIQPTVEFICPLKTTAQRNLTATMGSVIFNTTTERLNLCDGGMNWRQLEEGSGIVPNSRFTNYSDDELTAYLRKVARHNEMADGVAVNYQHGQANFDGNGSYRGSVTCSANGNVYFLPDTQCSQPNWHYLNRWGELKSYANSATIMASGYWGGAYHPTLKRIYLAPHLNYASATWHYIDCETNSVVPYTHGATGLVTQAYSSAIYIPGTDRIVFVPYQQATQTTWHYVTSTGTIATYTNTLASTGGGGYSGGVYCPTGIIVLVPCFQTPQTNWHAIFADALLVVASTPHGATVVNSAYSGAVWCHSLKRVYFIPYHQSNQTDWHYQDFAGGGIVAYAHGATGIVAGGYSGGVFCPTLNRVYLSPYSQGAEANWHYIDCRDGSVVAYPRPTGVDFAEGCYQGAVYQASTDRVTFIPSGQSFYSTFHAIQVVKEGLALASSAAFNGY